MSKKDKHIILGVHITDRIKHAQKVQELLTQYGCNIKTRIGFHDVDGTKCSMNGLLILELIGETKTCDKLAQDLDTLEGVEVQKMIFDHD
ncbi:MAG: hypothetical protein JXA96_04270 [Sedimentisphaerales bacterium]|nr:hypothetical protein [Sedimentisphaerales bacterium]